MAGLLLDALRPRSDAGPGNGVVWPRVCEAAGLRVIRRLARCKGGGHEERAERRTHSAQGLRGRVQDATRPRSPGVRGGVGGASLNPSTASRCGKADVPHWIAVGRAGLYPSGRSGSGMDPPGFYGRKRWQSRKLLGSVAERPRPMEGVSGLPAQSVHSSSTGARQLFDAKRGSALGASTPRHRGRTLGMAASVPRAATVTGRSGVSVTLEKRGLSASGPTRPCRCQHPRRAGCGPTATPAAGSPMPADKRSASVSAPTSRLPRVRVPRGYDCSRTESQGRAVDARLKSAGTTK